MQPETEPTKDNKAAFGTDPEGIVKRYLSEVKQYDAEYARYKRRCKQIRERWRDERKTDDHGNPKGGPRYNILHSNTQTLLPLLYSRRPDPIVERRFKDDDKVGRVASQVLERATDYAIDQYDFNCPMKRVSFDYALYDRGVAWVRYKPTLRGTGEFKRDEVQVTTVADKMYYSLNGKPVDEGRVKKDDSGVYVETEIEELEYEEVCAEYVNLEDFGHNVARVWEEVEVIWRRVFLTYEQFKKRFGTAKANEAKATHQPESDEYEYADEEKHLFARYVVYEFWDKGQGKVLWISPGYQKGPLDEKGDFLKLKGFFPTPRPLQTIGDSETLEPNPSFIQYRDLAQELDEYTSRIAAHASALKAVGLYDAAQEELANIMQASDGEMFPIENWAELVKNGGIQNAVAMLDVRQHAEIMIQLQGAREQVKQDIYEITGMSDIVRGQGDARETATAQQIKGQFATIRLADRQAEVQRYARDLIALKAEIIAEHFSPQTLYLMAGTDFIEPGDLPPDAQGNPFGVKALFAQAVQLLRNDAMRTYRIDIETDSTIAVDEMLERKQVVEFAQALDSTLERAIQVGGVVPELTEFLGELTMTMVRRFRGGRNLEASLEQGIKAIKERMRQPQPPSPEQIEAQMKQQKEQGEMALKNKELEMDFAMKGKELEIKGYEATIKEMQTQIDAFKAQMELLQTQLTADGGGNERRAAKEVGSPQLAMGMSAPHTQKKISNVKHTPLGLVADVEVIVPEQTRTEQIVLDRSEAS